MHYSTTGTSQSGAGTAQYGFPGLLPHISVSGIQLHQVACASLIVGSNATKLKRNSPPVILIKCFLMFIMVKCSLKNMLNET